MDTLHFDRSEQAAVAIIGIEAYARGFEFVLARRIRPATPGLDEDPTLEMRRRREPEEFPISVQFSDGRQAVSGRPRGDFAPTGPILQSRGGGGTSHSQLFQWWVWPLPPGRAAGVHLPVAGVRDRGNTGRHRRAGDPGRR